MIGSDERLGVLH